MKEGAWFRLGLIVPEPNTVAEPWLSAVLGRRATIHIERLPLDGRVAGMDASLPRARSFQRAWRPLRRSAEYHRSAEKVTLVPSE